MRRSTRGLLPGTGGGAKTWEKTEVREEDLILNKGELGMREIDGMCSRINPNPPSPRSLPLNGKEERETYPGVT